MNLYSTLFLDQINAIYATAPVGLCYVNSMLQVVSMNDHLRNLVDYTSQDVRDKRLSEVLGNPALELDKFCNEVLNNSTPILNREIRWSLDSSKKDCYWLCSCYPILTSGGVVHGINMVVQDITERKKGELDLARLASIVSNSYDAIIGKTLDGKITSWNHGAERMFGYKADSVIGHPISIIIPVDRLQEEEEIQNALRQGQHITIDESKRVRKDGVIIQVAITISPINNGINEIIGVSTIIRDITASKVAEQKARENEYRMHLILQATHIGTWDWKIDTQAVRWSANMEALHGRQPGCFDGTMTSVFSVVYPDDKAILQKAITQALESDGNYQVEYRIVTESGEIRWMEGKGQVLHDQNGNPERLAGVCMDITERKEAEQALRVNETMLRTQTEELAREHSQKDEFLAMLAHELRNPLAPISNMVQLMKIQEPGQREKTLPKALEVIGRQVNQIARLVDDLLDVARITRGIIELKSEVLDIREIVIQAADTASVWFNVKRQAFDLVVCDNPIYVHADATRLIQVISNLLNNASKYTGETGRISLSLTSVGQAAIISIADTGIGISADLLPHVFDLFTQADRSLDRRQGGLGLGLPLVKKLVDMHHGTVIAKSPGMGRGSEFIIRMPLAETCVKPTAGAAINDIKNIKKKYSMRILVVDDNVHSADAMAMLLETLDHSVKVAYSGPDALCFADQFCPDLVLLDIGLPLMDGYEVAKKLRERFGKQITLLALTGYSQQQGKLGLVDQYFDEYLLKPLSFDNLITLLAKHSSRMSNCATH